MMECVARFMIAVILLSLLGGHAEAQWRSSIEPFVGLPSNAPPTEPLTGMPGPRTGVSIGMGVSYVNAQDIADYIQGIVGRGQDIPEFKSSVEFFGAVSVPISNDWILKFEYAYLLGTYNVQSLFGPAEFSFSDHMPTIIGQYVLMEEGSYNVRVGAGAGYHFGALSESFGTLNDKLTGHGLGTVIELEANTAFGEDFYGYIGGNLRWEFIGDLTTSTRTISAGSIPTFHFFGLGARFGFTYYF